MQLSPQLSLSKPVFLKGTLWLVASISCQGWVFGAGKAWVIALIYESHSVRVLSGNVFFSSGEVSICQEVGRFCNSGEVKAAQGAHSEACLSDQDLAHWDTHTVLFIISDIHQPCRARVGVTSPPPPPSLVCSLTTKRYVCTIPWESTFTSFCCYHPCSFRPHYFFPGLRHLQWAALSLGSHPRFQTFLHPCLHPFPASCSPAVN